MLELDQGVAAAAEHNHRHDNSDQSPAPYDFLLSTMRTSV